MAVQLFTVTAGTRDAFISAAVEGRHEGLLSFVLIGRRMTADSTLARASVAAAEGHFCHGVLILGHLEASGWVEIIPGWRTFFQADLSLLSEEAHGHSSQNRPCRVCA